MWQKYFDLTWEVTMTNLRVAIGVAATTAALSGAANAAEFAKDHTIVVSDGECYPNNDGNCNTCDLGHVIRAAKCNNSYCDNMVYTCASPMPVNSGAITLSGPRFVANEFVPTRNYGWTSDEQGSSSTNAICPVGFAMVGMTSTGSYSDNVRTVCQQVDRAGTWSGITWFINQATPISEEAPNNISSTGFWFMGASCTGSYCDNMYYRWVSFS